MNYLPIQINSASDHSFVEWFKAFVFNSLTYFSCDEKNRKNAVLSHYVSRPEELPDGLSTLDEQKVWIATYIIIEMKKIPIFLTIVPVLLLTIVPWHFENEIIEHCKFLVKYDMMTVPSNVYAFVKKLKHRTGFFIESLWNSSEPLDIPYLKPTMEKDITSNEVEVQLVNYLNNCCNIQ